MTGPLRSLLLSVAVALACAVSSVALGQGGAPKFTFEIRVEKDAYWKAVAAYDKSRTDPAKVAASKFPAYSSLLVYIVPGSQADKAGLKKGWRVSAANGEEIWCHQKPVPPMENGKREVEVISPEGEKKKIQFEDGRIGYNCVNGYLPEIAALALIPRGKWDGDIMVATVAWNAGNHALAETALRLAVNRGMPPNPVLTHYASLLALDRGKPELARALNAEFLKKYPDPAKIPRFYRTGLRTLGASLGDFGLLKMATQEYEGLRRPALVPEIAEAWRVWKEAEERTPLLPLAKAASGPDLLSKCERVVVKWQSEAHVTDFEPARDGVYVREVQPGRYNRLSFAPPGEVRDMIWTTRFAYLETAPADADIMLTICLVDRQGKTDFASHSSFLPLDKSVVYLKLQRAFGSSNYVELAAGPCGASFISQCDLPGMNAEEYAGFKKLVESNSPESKKVTRNVNELSLIRIGREGEIVLNGKSLLHVPIDTKAEDLFCIFQNEGFAVVIDGMTLHKVGLE
jgi:hypothetical protein